MPPNKPRSPEAQPLEKIQIIHDTFIVDRRVKTGEILSAPLDDARHLISIGKAKLVDIEK